MPMVAKQALYTLLIVDDTDAQDPRKDNDNFGTMACFHNRYTLGDKVRYSEPEDFLRDLCYDTTPSGEIVALVMENKLDYVRFEPDKEDEESYHFMVYDDHYKKWYREDSFDGLPSDNEDEATNSIIEWTKIPDLIELAGKHNVILPLYLYDHSGITINTTDFSCPWDSGQLGWTYATHTEVEKEYGEITPETLLKAKNLLQSEVEIYDLYLTGQSYGFKLYEGKRQIDSCWGFLGSISDVPKYIKEHLPYECENIIDFLEYQPDRTHDDEYLEQTHDDEGELER